MANIAVYGGSFDPPHLGHVMVVSHLLLNDNSIDRIYVVPCHKHKYKDLTEYWHRFEMCRQTFAWLPRVKVDPIEHELGGESLTIRLVAALAERHPNDNLRFVMGADLLESAPEWEEWDTIKKLAPPLVIGRAGIAPRAPGDPTPISPIVSSTIVRSALACKNYQEAERYLAATVCEYIRLRGLYVNITDP